MTEEHTGVSRHAGREVGRLQRHSRKQSGSLACSPELTLKLLFLNGSF